MKIFSRIRRVYYFGYGANRDPDIVRAVIGRKPRVLGPAVLSGYRLGIQQLDQVPCTGPNPRAILHKTWGSEFCSYTAERDEESCIAGTLYKISLHDRHSIDIWELTPEGWSRKEVVTVTLSGNGKIYRAETQTMGPQQQIGRIVDGLHYSQWLQPKREVLRIASAVRQGAGNYG